MKSIDKIKGIIIAKIMMEEMESRDPVESTNELTKLFKKLMKESDVDIENIVFNIFNYYRGGGIGFGDVYINDEYLENETMDSIYAILLETDLSSISYTIGSGREEHEDVRFFIDDIPKDHKKLFEYLLSEDISVTIVSGYNEYDISLNNLYPKKEEDILLIQLEVNSTN